MIENEQPLFGQGGEKLDGEKWVTASLFLHQSGQRCGVPRCAMQGIDDESAYIVEPKGGKCDVIYPPPGLADCRQSQ